MYTKAFVLITLGITVSIMLGGYIYYESEYLPSQIENEKVVRDWLESQRKGLDGSEYWAVAHNSITFFALESYEIVDHPTAKDFGDLDRMGYYTVRIHSSTRDGQPIVRLWGIKVSGKQIWDVKPHEDRKRLFSE